jgi:hypothetical protein
MEGKSGFFTIQNEIISEKWKAIKRLKRVISNLSGVFLRQRRDKGRILGHRRCVLWASLARWHLCNPLASSTFSEDLDPGTIEVIF